MIPRLLLGLGLATLPAFCGAINLNTWYLFNWDGHQNSFATAAGTTPAAPWTFTGPGTFKLTDILVNQQQFYVSDNGNLQGISSSPLAPGAVNCGSNPDTCFGTLGMSTLSFSLGAGPHSLTIQTYSDLSSAGQAGFQTGTAYFQVCNNVDTCNQVVIIPPPPPPPGPGGVPEPTSMSLMGLGLGLGGVLLRWRKRK
jgi:PEP-CTERM motif